MKKTYIILGIVFLCLIGVFFLIPKTPKEEIFMHTYIEQVYSYEQFDSLCIADGIHNDLKEWDSVVFIDDSTKTPINQYMYVIEKNDTMIVYSAIPSDSTIFINKRMSIE